MRLADHVLDALVQAAVSEGQGGIPVQQQVVYLLSRGEPSERAVLPQDRSHVGGAANQPVVSASKRLVAELEPLVEDLPESLHVPA